MELETWNPVLASVWRVSWQAAVLVIIVLVVQRLFRKRLAPRWRYALWMLVLLRLLMPFSIESAVSIFNLARLPEAPTVLREQQVNLPVSATSVPADIPAASAAISLPAPYIEPSVSGASDRSVQGEAVSSPAATATGYPLSWPRLVFWAWLAGALVLCARLAWGNFQFARALRKVSPIQNPEVLSLLRECRAITGVRRNVQLIETSALESPALFGCFRLRLLLPAGMADRFSPRELRYIFLHELAHIRRGDVLVNWVMAFVQVVHWFNPLVWFGFHRMRADRELACDALALSFAKDDENRSYGETILKLLESFTRPASVPGLVGILEDKQDLAERLTMIARFKRTSRWSMFALLLMGALGFVTLTDAQSKRGEPAPKARKADAVKSADPGVHAFTKIDLDPFYDLKAAELTDFGVWEVVPKGAQVFDGVPFTVDGMIRLYGQIPPPHRTVYRDAVRGIPIGSKFAALYVLHGTGWSTDDGTDIARIVLKYVDGKDHSFVLIYGEHVRDWWKRDPGEVDEVSNADSLLAWEGDHAMTGLRFYKSAFINPRPEMQVASIDIISSKSQVTPAIVAITVGPKQSPDRPKKVSQATTPTATPVRAIDDATAPGVRPDLTGRVTSKSGDPLSATVFISTASPKVGTSPYCPSCYADCRKTSGTSPDGKFRIASLDPTLLFRILVVAKGYKPKFISKVDPASGPVTVELEPSNAADAKPENSIRGRVVDADGKPILGAVVESHGYRTKGGGGHWGNLSGFDPMAVSDENGEFLITSTKPFYSMDVKVTARAFANKTFTSLVSGSKVHQLTMTEGAAISGRVLLDGKPLREVSVGLVSVDRGMEKYTGNFDVGTDEKGRFEFVNLPPNREYYIYGLMNSIKPYGAIPIMKVQSGKDGSMTKVGDLVVQRSHRLAGRVVLGDGKPLPSKTRLLVSRENAWDSMQIDLDENGAFNATGLPAEGVSLSLRLSGYHVSPKNRSLDLLNPYRLVGRITGDITNLVYLLEPGKEVQPNYDAIPPDAERPNNRTLAGAEAARADDFFSVSGRVLDAQGNAIPRFRVTTGFESHDQMRWDNRSVDGTNGMFTVQFDRKRSQPALRVDAEGHLPAATTVLPKDQKDVKIVLQKGAGPSGRVILSDGKPVAGVSVILICTGRDYLRVDEKGMFQESRGKKLVVATDSEGKFSLPAELEMQSVAAAGKEGFGGVSLEALAKNPDIVIQRWGKISGTLKRTSGVGKGEQLDVKFTEETFPGQDRVYMGETAITDDEGRFSFDRVPPGKITITYRLTSGEHSGWTNERLEDVVLKPGGTLAVNIETGDRPKDRGSRIVTKPTPKPVVQPGLGPKGIVLLPDGKPAAEAEVALLAPGVYIALEKGQLQAHGAREEGLVVNSSIAGEFTLPKHDEASGIVAVHSAGFARLSVKEFEASRKINLQPWGELEGTLRIGGAAAAKQVVMVSGDQGGLHFGHDAFRSTTDDQGRFGMTFVPPGELRLARLVPNGKSSWLHATFTNVVIKPGEVTKVNVAIEGRTVIGKAVLPGKEGDWRNAYGTIHTPLVNLGPMPPETEKELRAVYIAKQTELLKRNRHYPIVFAEDGSFRSEAVPAGEYEISLNLSTGGIGSGETIGSLKQKIVVPPSTGANQDPVDIGTLQLQPAKRLNVGDVAPDFNIKTLDGKPLKLSDFRGKFVLLDFWATWCGPCVAEMPTMKEVYETFGREPNFVMIGLSLDQKIDAPKSFVAKNEIKWTQGFLGDWSSTQLPNEYGVRGIPALFLMGPDGKIVAKGFRGEDIKATVAQWLKKGDAVPVPATPTGKKQAALEKKLRLVLTMEDDQPVRATIEFKTADLNSTVKKVVQGVAMGTNEISIAELQQGDYYVYVSGRGFASQWRKFKIEEDWNTSPKSFDVKLYRLRYVVLRYAFNTTNGRTLVDGPEGVNRKGRAVLSHWASFSPVEQDWQVWMKSEGNDLFGPVPFLEFHRFTDGFGFLKAPDGVPFEELKEAPEAGYRCENIRATKGLTLFCRVNGNQPNGLGYGKIIIDDVTETAPAEPSKDSLSRK